MSNINKSTVNNCGWAILNKKTKKYISENNGTGHYPRVVWLSGPENAFVWKVKSGPKGYITRLCKSIEMYGKYHKNEAVRYEKLRDSILSDWKLVKINVTVNTTVEVISEQLDEIDTVFVIDAVS